MAKGTKFLNPADKARKEARKKELKKNKKQRQQVRSVAIESRNPEQIIKELEDLDKQEYLIGDQPQQQSATGNIELLYKEKRKRLKALFARILVHYQKEDQERFNQLKKLETDYETKHKKAEKEYEAIKAAKEVKLDDVILPPEPVDPDSAGLAGDIDDDDPLMSDTIYVSPLNDDVKPPGCPPGPPPNLKLLADQLGVALLVPPTHLTAQHMPPKLPSFNKNPTQGGPSAARYKKPLYPGKGAKFNAPQNDESTIQQKRNRPSETQASPANVAAKATNPVKKAAVIESKPVIFVPKVTKFVPASVRSKMGPKVSEKDKPAKT